MDGESTQRKGKWSKGEGGQGSWPHGSLTWPSATGKVGAWGWCGCSWSTGSLVPQMMWQGGVITPPPLSLLVVLQREKLWWKGFKKKKRAKERETQWKVPGWWWNRPAGECLGLCREGDMPWEAPCFVQCSDICARSNGTLPSTPPSCHLQSPPRQRERIHWCRVPWKQCRRERK